MLELVKPKFDDLWFRESLMADEKTMSYNAKYRNHGYGSEGLQLLCEAAKANGITVMHDDIAADNPSYKLFLNNGFEVDYQNDEVVMVKKVL